MTPEEQSLWREADRIFSTLLDLPAMPRADDVRRMALSPALEERVIALLDGHRNAGPADEIAQGTDLGTLAASSIVGRSVGGWVLEELVGSGGMATVYRARRETDDFDQIVALKMLGWAHLSAPGAARFEQEKRILASLRHPGIAAMLDGGVAEDGTPFIVMEYVDGERIDCYVEKHVPDVKSRVELFLAVVQAVAFAQQNLIVHRDIKPSNILVDSHDRVKLLDFGIARLMSADSEATNTRAYTPGFAAPEQLAGEAITTATDVFGLGATLYRLICGRPAIDPAINVAHPGTDQRVLSPRQLGVDRDLSNIIMMALREEPEDRYPTAQALHDDLTNWLEQRPVAATGHAAGYRFRKLLRRHRATVAGAALALTVGIAGLSATLWQAERAKDQAVIARQEAAASRAVTRYVQLMVSTLSPSQGGAIDRERMLRYYLEQSHRELMDSPSVLASVQFALAELANDMGLYPQAIEIHRQALALREAEPLPDPVAVGESRLALAKLLALPGTNRDEVGARFAEALDLVSAHGGDVEAYFSGLVAYGTHLTRHADVPGARAAFAEASDLIASGALSRDLLAVDLWLAQAELAARLGQIQEATDHIQRSLERLESIVGLRHVKVARARAMQGLLQTGRLGEFDAGLANLREAVSIDAEFFEKPTWQSIEHLGLLAIGLAQAGDYEQAVEVEQRRLAQAREVVGDPSRLVAVSLRNLGRHQLRLKRPLEAERLFRESLQTHEAFDPSFHPGVVLSMVNLAGALEYQGRFTEAVQAMEVAVTGLESWEAVSDLYLAEHHMRLALLQALEGELEAATAGLRKARPLLEGDPRADLADSVQAYLYLRQGQRDRAARLIEQVIPRLREHKSPYWGELARAEHVLAMALCPADPRCEQAYDAAMSSLLTTFGPDYWRVADLRGLRRVPLAQ